MSYEDYKPNTVTKSYLLEPILNSELVLINNAKKLALDPTLLNETNLVKIQELRDRFIELDDLSAPGSQAEKRKVRDELRDLSSATYTNRDKEMFGNMIIMMTDKIVTRPQFSNYTFKDEMKSLSIQYILKYTHSFDPYKQSQITNQYVSAFAYISTIIFNACIATINKFNKEQAKAKEDFLERQKLIHKDPNRSTLGPEYSTPSRSIRFVTLEEGELLKNLKSITIQEETEVWIPKDYKITEKDYNYVMHYFYNISIRRIK